MGRLIVITETSNTATLNKIIATIGELPASPAIVSSVMGLASDLNTDVDEISKVLSADQSLSAKVLKLSNSSYYGRSKGVSSLQEAILVLGFFTVRSMVMATSAHAMYRKSGDGDHEIKLWHHSLSTAMAARQIARHIKHSQKEEIFIAALMHDIGKLVLLQQLHEQYLAVIETVESEGSSFLKEESGQLGLTHCEVAAVLLDKWSFPTELSEAVCTHHNPLSAEDGKPVPMAQVINLGNQMAKKLDVGFADEKVENLAELDSARLMALDEETLNEIFEEFREHYQAESSIYEEA